MNRYIFLLSIFLFSACSNTKSSHTSDEQYHPTLQATLWVQNAVEYDALTLMAYQTAATKIGVALADKSWTAELTQIGKEIESLPPAIILDIDETVLDNSPFQARMIVKNSGYNPVEWEKWVLEANAEAICGALQLTKDAANAGITVIYLSNREANTEEATRENLEHLGFPISDATDVVLLKGEQENWTSSKVNRRLMVASNYRVLMLFGDDYNDFLPAKNMSKTERDVLLNEHQPMIGKKWFIMPNPIYGSWTNTTDNAVLNSKIDE
jgi:acid phosphatase